MELFDKKFVHFMWDDELEGKKCFVADYIGYLRAFVEKGNECDLHEVRKSDDVDAPFQANDGLNFTFAYYDPNYEVKKAFNAGKKIQFRCGSTYWQDYTNQNPCWDDEDREWRVKPKEKKYRPYVCSAEMIADFIDRFKVNCPPYCEPLIWVKSKNTGYRYLITTFYESAVMISADSPVCCSLWQLSDFYTYLDGSPCGMKVKEH